MQQRLEDTRDGEGRQAYQLLYDADEGHEAEAAAVTFLDERECLHAAAVLNVFKFKPGPRLAAPPALLADTLYDLTNDEQLAWRVEGNTWEPPVEEGTNAGVVTLEQVNAEVARRER